MRTECLTSVPGYWLKSSFACLPKIREYTSTVRPCRITSRQAFVCSPANHKTLGGWGKFSDLQTLTVVLASSFRRCKWLSSHLRLMLICSWAPCVCVKSHYREIVRFPPQSSIFPQTSLALLHHPSPNLQPCICPRTASPWRIIRSPHRARQIKGRGGAIEKGGWVGWDTEGGGRQWKKGDNAIVIDPCG